jgi:tetratricopeptide (TPR) repeat protein
MQNPSKVIKDLSKKWDLAGLSDLLEIHINTMSPEVKEAFTEAFGYHYHQLTMDYELGKLIGDSADLVNDLLSLLEKVRMLKPEIWQEVSFSVWMRELARLTDNPGQKWDYLCKGFQAIEDAIVQYGPKTDLHFEQSIVLQEQLQITEFAGEHTIETLNQLLQTIFSSLNLENARKISHMYYNIVVDSSEQIQLMSASKLTEYEKGMQVLAATHPEVRTIQAKVLSGYIEPDNQKHVPLISELDTLLDFVMLIPDFDPEILNDLADNIFKLGKETSLENCELRHKFLNQSLALFEKILAADPKFRIVYSKKAQYYEQMALDYFEHGKTEPAIEYLKTAIAYVEQIKNEHFANEFFLTDYRTHLYQLYNDKLLFSKDKDYNLMLVKIMRQNIDERFAFYKKIFKNRKDHIGAYANDDHLRIAHLLLKSNETEAAWETLSEWFTILQEQKKLWNYDPYDLKTLLEDEVLKPFHHRIEKLADAEKNDSKPPDSEATIIAM